MHYDFCTLFDKNYLTRGLALHYSLKRTCQSFRFWILCMDQTTYEILTKLKLENVTLIRLQEFEDKKLLAIKPTRTVGEYCWTCTPSLPLYILKCFPQVKMISYVDADLYFYSSPEPLFKEFGQNSIMIIPHRFASAREVKEKAAGIYNVGMLTFRRDRNGRKCLLWWRERCLEWCYNRQEDGKVGDQKYLDQFPKLFKKVCVLSHIGGGVAPWNIGQYRVWKNKDKIFVDKFRLIFYHFLGLQIYKPLPFLLPSPLGNYGEISRNRSLIYDQYFQKIYQETKKVRHHFPNFSAGFFPRPQFPLLLKEEILSKLVSLKDALS